MYIRPQKHPQQCPGPQPQWYPKWDLLTLDIASLLSSGTSLASGISGTTGEGSDIVRIAIGGWLRTMLLVETGFVMNFKSKRLVKEDSAALDDLALGAAAPFEGPV